MKTTPLILIILILIGCDSEQHTRRVCNCDQLRRANEFVISTIEDANNMSDEEMEDVIDELQSTAIQLNCPTAPVWVDDRGEVDWQKESADSCKSIFPYYH
jgi:hypothetical protein